MIVGYGVVPFRREHEAAMEYRPDSWAFVRASGPMEAQFMAAAEHTLSVTMIRDGKVLGIAGVMPAWTGVGSLWFRPSIHFNAYPISTFKASMRFISYAKWKMGLHRIFAVVKAGVVQHMKWAARLGLEAEGLLRKHGPDGSDYIMCARTW